MGRIIRIIEPTTVYAVVQRTVDNTAFFAPNHDPRHPLLDRGCPSEALNPSSPIVPVPSIINIVGAAAARALRLSPVNLHVLAVTCDRLIALISAKNGDIGQIPGFLRDFHSKIARDLNRLREREGHLFASRSSLTPCANDEQAFERLLRALIAPVEEGLVARVEDAPFFTSFHKLARGEEQRYWDIDWEAYWEAGGTHNGKLCPKEFMEWRTLELTPLPSLAKMPGHRRRTLVRRRVEVEESRVAEETKRAGRRVRPMAKLFGMDPRGRVVRRRDHAPLIHASTRRELEAYRVKLREVTRRHRSASAAFRMGRFYVPFPPGTFRPPLTSPIPFFNSS